jgi:hypothetical protein
MRVSYSLRDPLPTGPSKLLVVRYLASAVLLNRLRLFLLTQALASTEAKGTQVWHSLQVCFIFRVGNFATVTTSASYLSLRYSNLGTILAPFYYETWTHSVLSFATHILKYGTTYLPFLARNLGAQRPSFALHRFKLHTKRARNFAFSLQLATF